MAFYLIIGNPKVFTFETEQQLQAALNSRVQVGEEHTVKLIQGEELSVEVVQEIQTFTQPVNVLKIKGR